MRDKRVCFTTYIYGDNYQDYIPLMLYSVYKAYPEYSIIIFVSGKLRDDVIKIINLIGKVYKNYEIIENVFDDCPNMKPIKAKTLRWVLWSDRFKEFDYLYYIDSDILYVREPILLHEQHVRHMNYIGSDCCSNIVRKTKLSNTNIIDLLRVLYYSGFLSVFKYCFTSYSFRMTGLHFVVVDKYFSYITPMIINKYKNLIYTGEIFKKTIYPNDEAVLYKMMEEAGCDMSVFAIQKTSISMFDSTNPERAEFCPHHGVHLGIFRFTEYPNWAKAQLDSADYLFYKEQFKEQYLTDSLFLEIKKYFNKNMKLMLDKMFKYYNMNIDGFLDDF